MTKGFFRRGAAVLLMLALVGCSTNPSSQTWPATVVSFDQMKLLGGVHMTLSVKLMGERPRGTVGMQLWVDERGQVRNVRLIQSSGHPNLDEGAMQSAWHLRFQPWQESGKPVPVTVVMPYRMI